MLHFLWLAIYAIWLCVHVRVAQEGIPRGHTEEQAEVENDEFHYDS